MVQKTRRTHTKSRGGCQECKRRKLKCGGEKPVCAGCIKRGIQCKYLAIGPSPSTSTTDSSAYILQANQDPHVSVTNAGSSALQFKAPKPSLDPQLECPIPADTRKKTGHFDMEDMALWHHFIKWTAATLSNPWKEDLPQLALSCDYLLHGILATSALHLGCRSDPKEKERYDYLASQHQDLALGPFQQAMLTIGAENASQLFAFSTLLMVFNFASYRSREYLFPFSDGAGEYQGLSNWMACLRGSSSIVYAAMKHVEAGPLGFVVTAGRQMQLAVVDGAVPHPEVDQSLSLLTETALNMPAIKTTTTVNEMEAYIDAIKRLRALLAASARGLESVLQRITTAIWVGAVSETFLRLLNERRAPALIIMAHYCLLLKKCEDCWYMERRSFHLFEAVQQSLGEEWAPHIQYQLRVIHSKS